MIAAQPNSTQKLYNATATHWVRGEPSSLSDFTARPAILEMCEPVQALHVLDLGCGEGYCSRALHQRGAKSIIGLDLSEEMIAAAQAQEQLDQFGIQFQTGCATNLSELSGQQFDLVVAVFLFNYLTIDQTRRCMTEVYRLLKPGARFIFSIPHPSFPYMRAGEYPFYFEVQEQNYFSGRDRIFPGRIWKRDGSWLDVQLVHKTLEDFFNAMKQAGFTSMPALQELKVKPEHIALDPEFFTPLLDYPLHIAIEVTR